MEKKINERIKLLDKKLFKKKYKIKLPERENSNELFENRFGKVPVKRTNKNVSRPSNFNDFSPIGENEFSPIISRQPSIRKANSPIITRRTSTPRYREHSPSFRNWRPVSPAKSIIPIYTSKDKSRSRVSAAKKKNIQKKLNRNNSPVVPLIADNTISSGIPTKKSGFPFRKKRESTRPLSMTKYYRNDYDAKSPVKKVVYVKR
jgi:hypothetical protein